MGGLGGMKPDWGEKLSYRCKWDVFGRGRREWGALCRAGPLTHDEAAWKSGIRRSWNHELTSRLDRALAGKRQIAAHFYLV